MCVVDFVFECIQVYRFDCLVIEVIPLRYHAVRVEILSDQAFWLFAVATDLVFVFVCSSSHCRWTTVNWDRVAWCFLFILKNDLFVALVNFELLDKISFFSPGLKSCQFQDTKSFFVRLCFSSWIIFVARRCTRSMVSMSF